MSWGNHSCCPHSVEYRPYHRVNPILEHLQEIHADLVHDAFGISPSSSRFRPGSLPLVRVSRLLSGFAKLHLCDDTGDNSLRFRLQNDGIHITTPSYDRMCHLLGHLRRAPSLLSGIQWPVRHICYALGPRERSGLCRFRWRAFHARPVLFGISLPQFFQYAMFLFGTYTITIELAYSCDDTSAGLVPKKAPSSGIVTWTWKVGTRTTPGNWPVYVTVNRKTIKLTLHVS